MTWSSATAAIAAGRRWSLRGDRGGRAEVDSVWIHLDSATSGRPRIEGFEVYGDAAGRPPGLDEARAARSAAGRPRQPWPLRVTDIDLHGHVNNAVYWQAVEHAASRRPASTRGRPLVAELDYREPIDLDDARRARSRRAQEESLLIGFRAADGISAVAGVRQR